MTEGDRERFRRDYAPIFLQYLSQRGEPGLGGAYELGRRAMTERLGMLDLARIHHTVLLDVLKSHRTTEELEDIARAGSEFLVEALATFEMAQRGFMELREAAATQAGGGSEGRVATERATGIIMERLGLDADAALEWIRQAAARRGNTVEMVAADLVGRSPQPPEPAGGADAT